MDQKKLFKFLSEWLGATILMIVLSYVLPDKLVLGNAYVTRPMAAIILGFVLTGGFFAVEPLTKKLNIKPKDERGLAAIFFAVNSVLIWIVKRLADISGVGISSIIFVLIVAAVLTLGQYYIDKYSDQFLKKK